MATKSNPKGYKRRNYLINPEFQLTVLGFFAGLAMVTVGIFFWAAKMIFSNFLAQANALGLPAGHIIVQYIDESAHMMNMVLTSTSILLFLFLTIGGLILSHQIAGPIYRLKKHIQQVNDGKDFKDLAFRKKDFFQDIVADYNLLLEKVRNTKGS